MRSNQAKIERLERQVKAIRQVLIDNGVKVTDYVAAAVVFLRERFRLKQAIERAKASTEQVTGKREYDAGWHDCRSRFLDELENGNDDSDRPI